MPKVLKWATEEVDNPDCRDRGFMYWRLLSTDPAAARNIVLAEKPSISTETDRMDRQLLDQLLLHGATLSSIFHRQPQTFIRGSKARYLPDSNALDETARRYASTHLYSKPVAKNPYASSSSTDASAPVSSSLGKPSLPSMSSMNEGGSAETGATPAISNIDDELRADEKREGADAAMNGSSAAVTLPPRANASALPEGAPVSPTAANADTAAAAGGGGGATETDMANDRSDPYAMLGDDFGGMDDEYAVDAPKPRSGGIDDLLA